MIELRGVSKIYGKKDNTFAALSDIDLTVERGQTVSIVGKSGSGKSTLMHVMSGLDKPTAGQVIVNDYDLMSLKSKAMDNFRAKQIGFIFQSFFIESNQTCYNNVALPLEINKTPRSKRGRLVKSALKAVGLLDKINEKAGNLSGGEKQRLSIARAVISKPKIIFADEPTGNLDSVNGDMVIKLLFGLNKHLKSTLCIVTHDPELAAKCSMQVTLKDGKVINASKSRATAGGRS